MTGQEGAEASKGVEILREAWQHFAVLDTNAIRQQRRWGRYRAVIWILGILTTVLAVAHGVSAPLDGDPGSGNRRLHLRRLVVLMPILSGVVAGVAGKVYHSLNWVPVRAAAENIKREIFIYRCAGSPTEEPGTATIRDEQLAEQLGLVLEQLSQSDVVHFGLHPYSGELPPKHATAPEDDGFSDLSPETYLKWRLEDQLGFYRSKTVALDRRLRRLHWGIALLGGVGTFLAYTEQEAWIPVSVSVTAALTGYLEQQGVDSTLAEYSRAALQLEKIRVWWRGTDADVREVPGAFTSLVQSTESVLRTEQEQWTVDMQKTLDDVIGDRSSSEKEQEDKGDRAHERVDPPIQ